MMGAKDQVRRHGCVPLQGWHPLEDSDSETSSTYRQSRMRRPNRIETDWSLWDFLFPARLTLIIAWLATVSGCRFCSSDTGIPSSRALSPAHNESWDRLGRTRLLAAFEGALEIGESSCTTVMQSVFKCCALLELMVCPAVESSPTASATETYCHTGISMLLQLLVRLLIGLLVEVDAACLLDPESKLSDYKPSMHSFTETLHH